MSVAERILVFTTSKYLDYKALYGVSISCKLKASR